MLDSKGNKLKPDANGNRITKPYIVHHPVVIGEDDNPYDYIVDMVKLEHPYTNIAWGTAINQKEAYRRACATMPSVMGRYMNTHNKRGISIMIDAPEGKKHLVVIVYFVPYTNQIQKCVRRK